MSLPSGSMQIRLCVRREKVSRHNEEKSDCFLIWVERNSEEDSVGYHVEIDDTCAYVCRLDHEPQVMSMFFVGSIITLFSCLRL
jgi:hypothetical protein